MNISKPNSFAISAIDNNYLSMNSQAKTIKLDLYLHLHFQNKTAKPKKNQRKHIAYLLHFVYVLLDVAVYQLYRAVWKTYYFGIWKKWYMALDSFETKFNPSHVIWFIISYSYLNYQVSHQVYIQVTKLVNKI